MLKKSCFKLDLLKKEYGAQNQGIAPDKKRSVLEVREHVRHVQHRSPSLTKSLGARRPFAVGLFLVPLFLSSIHPISYASIDGWYTSGKLGGRILLSQTHRDILSLSSFGLNIGYQFSKPFSIELGFFCGGDKAYSFETEQKINYNLGHIITGIKSIFFSYPQLDLYTKVGLGWVLSPEERNMSECLSILTQVGLKYFMKPQVSVGCSFSIITTAHPMALASVDVSYYFG